MCAEMRAAVRKFKERGKLDEPTEEQWRMIFANYPAICVQAGAGSGKSTTLVLRVVFMIHYLRIPIDQILAFRGTC